jgi:hypothetical protein
MAEARVMVRHLRGTDSDGDTNQPVICVAHLAAPFPLAQLVATRKGFAAKETWPGQVAPTAGRQSSTEDNMNAVDRRHVRAEARCSPMLTRAVLPFVVSLSEFDSDMSAQRAIG